MRVDHMAFLAARIATRRIAFRMAADGRPPELCRSATSELITRLYPFESVSIDSFKPLPSYDDRNLYFTGILEKLGGRACTNDEAEEEFVLKLYNRNVNSASVLGGLNDVMLWLRERGVPCCCPISSRDGTYSVETELEPDKTEAKFVVKVLRFISGEVMDKLEQRCLTPELGFSVGEMVGKLGLALQDFTHPAIDDRRLENWDLMHFTDDVKRYIPHLGDGEKREVTLSIVDIFEENVQPVIPRMGKGVVHNDVNGLNLLFNVSGDKCELSGLIDFGDCIRTCYLFDVAIMMAYGMVEKRNPVEFVGHMFQGYNSVFPLSHEELGCLYYSVLARLCQSMVNGEYRYTLEPWNSYLLTTPAEAWKLMKLLLSMGKKKVEQIWGVC